MFRHAALFALALTTCQGNEVVPVAVGHEPPTRAADGPRSALEACLSAASDLGDDAAPIRAAFCQELSARGAPGGAIAIVRETGAVESFAFGQRCSDSDAPVTPTTGFRVGSLTKAMLAAALVAMADAGQVDLDAPIGRERIAAIGLDSALARATLRQLLDHHAGLADHLPTAALRTADRNTALRALVGTPLAEPGETWTYANGGYALAAALVEDATTTPIATLIRGHVLQPLGLTHATLVPPQPAGDDVACGHLRGADGTWQAHRIADDFDRFAFAVTAAAPAGAMVANVDELARFAAAFAGAIEPAPAWASHVRRRVEGWPVATGLAPRAGYALGLDVWVARDGTIVLEHRGDTGDFSAYLAAVPSRRRAFAMVVDASARLPATRAAFLTWARVDPRNYPNAPGDLDGYVGRYRDRSGQVLDVAREGSTVVLRHGNTSSVRLVHVDHHRFTLAATRDEVVFLRDGDAPARALRSPTWFARRVD